MSQRSRRSRQLLAVLLLQTFSNAFFYFRSPSTPDLSTDELPDDITNDMADIPNDLELNQEDFSDVLPRLPDDLQDFDLFEGCPTAHSQASLVLFKAMVESPPVCLFSKHECCICL